MVPTIEGGGEWMESHVGSECSRVRASGNNLGGNLVEMLTYRKALCLLPWGYVGIRIGDLIKLATDTDYDPEIRAAWDERCDIGGWNSCVYCWRWIYWDSGGGHDGD